ncbi:unnamed protein product [Calypogeia fissa]
MGGKNRTTEQDISSMIPFAGHTEFAGMCVLMPGQERAESGNHSRLGDTDIQYHFRLLSRCAKGLSKQGNLHNLCIDVSKQGNLHNLCIDVDMVGCTVMKSRFLHLVLSVVLN